MLVGNWVAGSLGIGLGYHRLLTHRSFQTPKWLERVLAVCGTLALQSGPLQWVTTHRIHHAFTETDKDPHSPRNGVFWSHVGWIFFGTGQNHSELVKQRYSPDLMKDKFLVLLSDYYVVPTVISGVIMLAVGGWSMVLWGVFLRVVLGWHSTWLVNSMTHIWGTRRFETRDDSRNNLLIGLLAFGEGWHNNHHAHPTSARHGLAWYEFDLNWIQIRLLELAGLAKKVKAFDLATYNEKMELKRAA
jgi:stearoyl-CoA desaturase (delta-9 desaturase)